MIYLWICQDSGVIKLPQGIYRSFMSCSDNPGVTGSSQVTLQKGQGFYVIVARKQDKLSTLVVSTARPNVVSFCVMWSIFMSSYVL